VEDVSCGSNETVEKKETDGDVDVHPDVRKCREQSKWKSKEESNCQTREEKNTGGGQTCSKRQGCVPSQQ
jgi:hypothetical protein